MRTLLVRLILCGLSIPTYAQTTKTFDTLPLKSSNYQQIARAGYHGGGARRAGGIQRGGERQINQINPANRNRINTITPVNRNNVRRNQNIVNPVTRNRIRINDRYYRWATPAAGIAYIVGSGCYLNESVNGVIDNNNQCCTDDGNCADSFYYVD